MYYLGIDGGGTKTAFALMNEEGMIVASYETTGCNFYEIGKEGIIELFLHGLQQVRGEIPYSDMKAAAGIPFFGESESLMQVIPEIIEAYPVPLTLVNDVDVGFYGALGDHAGINIVAGTGSIAVGFDEVGNSARSGGFGPEFFADEGSAYWIGNMLINEFTRQADGRSEKTLLYHSLRKEFGLTDDFYVVPYLLENGYGQRDQIAQLSRFASTYAEQGDTACLALFDRVAYELYLLATSIKSRITFRTSPIPVSYTGGVFQCGELVLSPLRYLLEEDGMTLVAPREQPVYGACLIARKS